MNPLGPKYFDPAVYEAAKTGNLPTIAQYIMQGGWVDMPDAKGKSMLYYACKKDHKPVIQYLMTEGAHTYPSLRGRNPLTKASKEVRQIVERMEAERKEKTALVHSLNHLTGEKAAKLGSVERAMDFIYALPRSLQKQSLQSFAPHVAFTAPNALSMIDLAAEEDQVFVGGALVQGFLACGDIPGARSAIDKLPPDTRRQFVLQMECFELLFSQAEKALLENPSLFHESIKQAFEHLNIYHEKPQEVVAELIETISKAGTITKALEAANALANPELRGFVRAGLCHCGLEDMADSSKKAAEKKVMKQGNVLKEQLDPLLVEAQETKDFSKAIAFAEKIDDHLFKMQAFLDIGYHMCELHQYENAYNVVDTYLDRSHENCTFILERFTDLLNELSQSEWSTKFSQLKAP